MVQKKGLPLTHQRKQSLHHPLHRIPWCLLLLPWKHLESAGNVQQRERGHVSEDESQKHREVVDC